MKRPRFEYRTIELMHGSQPPAAKLADLGTEGWEMVSVVALGLGHIAFLKRVADDPAATIEVTPGQVPPGIGRMAEPLGEIIVT